MSWREKISKSCPCGVDGGDRQPRMDVVAIQMVFARHVSRGAKMQGHERISCFAGRTSSRPESAQRVRRERTLSQEDLEPHMLAAGQRKLFSKKICGGASAADLPRLPGRRPLKWSVRLVLRRVGGGRVQESTVRMLAPRGRVASRVAAANTHLLRPSRTVVVSTTESTAAV